MSWTSWDSRWPVGVLTTSALELIFRIMFFREIESSVQWEFDFSRSEGISQLEGKSGGNLWSADVAQVCASLIIIGCAKRDQNWSQLTLGSQKAGSPYNISEHNPQQKGALIVSVPPHSSCNAWAAQAYLVSLLVDHPSKARYFISLSFQNSPPLSRESRQYSHSMYLYLERYRCL